MTPLAVINTATPLRAAEVYIELGFHPIPIPQRDKKPTLKNWPNLRCKVADLPRFFGDGPQNIGLILGGDAGLADIDCDTVEAAVAAGIILPRTGMIFGRPSRRASHHFYHCDPPALLAQYRDPTDEQTLVELRCCKKDGGTGLQTVVPPSVHVCGEKINFEPGGDGLPVRIAEVELRRATAWVAAAALLARRWPETGARHTAMLALAGGMWRAAVSIEDAKRFCRAVYRAVSTHDPSALNRSDSEVADTYRRGTEALERGEESKVTGWPTLAGIVGEKVVVVAAGWLGSHMVATAPVTSPKSVAPTASTPEHDGGNVAGVVEEPEEPPSRTHTYEEQNGTIIRRKAVRTREGCAIEVVPLANFTARITGDISEDDGVEVKRHFEIEAIQGGRIGTFVIPAGQFATMEWTIQNVGPRAVVHPNQKDWTRAAIQFLSNNIEEKRIYTHTGFRKVGDIYVYMHAAGGIGPNGPVPGVNVQLSGALARYELRLPENPAQLVLAIQASLRVIDNAPDHISFPLLASVYRAPMRACDFGVWFAGPTGVLKSEEAALAQQHYGSEMNSRHLPANFASTGNALEMIAFHAKDALLVVDDFAPHGSQQDVARYHSAAERLLRGAGNSQGRARLDANANLRTAKEPRGLILATGEDIPRGQSIRGRVLIVEVAPGDVRKDILTENQAAAEAGLYAVAMGAYIQDLAANYERVQDEFRKTVLATRAKATMVHARTPGIVADLHVGFDLFLRFALSAGAISETRRADLAERCWLALNRVAKSQRGPQEASEPARRFLDLLAGALAAGRAHVASILDDKPVENEAAWGWRWEDTGKGLKCVAKGQCVGWMESDDLYLESTSAYAAVQEFGRNSGEPLVVSEIALAKRLKEKGLLASVDAKRETNTIRKTVRGASHKVLHLKTGALLDDVGFFRGDVGSMSGSGAQPDNDLPNGMSELQPNVGFVGLNIQGESYRINPHAEKAERLNRIFLEQGATGLPGRITAAEVEQGEASMGVKREKR